MIHTCPRDRQRLDEGPHGDHRCAECGGIFVPRTHLVELLLSDVSDAPRSSEAATAGAARCPADGSIMARTLVETGSGSTVYLDRCGSCLGVWFDAGEWTALATAHLLQHLDEFWSAEYRARQRHERERADDEARLRAQLGDALYEQVAALARALRQHPRRSQALALLRELSA